jgi:hypothetical protein
MIISSFFLRWIWGAGGAFFRNVFAGAYAVAGKSRAGVRVSFQRSNGVLPPVSECRRLDETGWGNVSGDMVLGSNAVALVEFESNRTGTKILVSEMESVIAGGMVALVNHQERYGLQGNFNSALTI